MSNDNLPARRRVTKPSYNQRLRALGIQPVSAAPARYRSGRATSRYSHPQSAAHASGSAWKWLGLVVIGLVLSAMGFSARDGDEVRVSIDGHPDAAGLVEAMNSRLNGQVRVTLVESGADADVSFREDIGHPEADAYAITFAGSISVSNDAPPDRVPHILIHELLHVAGVAHEMDESSIMYPYTPKGMDGRIDEQHIRALRRLSGITPPERIPAWISTWGGATP